MDKYQDASRELEGMPPPRAFDHTIKQVESSSLANIRPYQYTYFLKKEIEAQVKKMLKESIIQPSINLFSSPLLLVMKKDGTWRFCIDNRELNSTMVKDKFLIPIIDDLLDEINGPSVFSNIDLRVGSYLIRVREADIHKMAFRTR